MIHIYSEKGGELRILDPWPEAGTRISGIDTGNMIEDAQYILIRTQPGDRFRLEAIN